MSAQATREEFRTIMGRIRVDLARLELLCTQLEAQAEATQGEIDAPLSVAEAAAKLGVHKQSIKAAIDRGEIRCDRLGRRILIPRSEVARRAQARGPR